jgi:hypothetical protein
MVNIKQWAPFIDRHGFLQDRPNHTSGNGIMYSVYLALLHENHPIPERIMKFHETMEKCWVPGGGFNRTPHGGFSKDLNQADDYLALALIDVILKTDYSSRLIDISRKSWGIINNVKPGKYNWKAWIFRMPSVRETLQFAKGETPDPLGVLMWCGSVLLSLFKLHHRDSRIKAWIKVETACRTVAKESQVIRLTCWFWRLIFSKRFKGVGHAEYFVMPHPARDYFWGYLPTLPREDKIKS